MAANPSSTPPAPQAPNSPTPPVLLTVREAAKVLRISSRTLFTRTQDGAIPHIRLGGRVLYPLQQLREWMANKSQGGTR